MNTRSGSRFWAIALFGFAFTAISATGICRAQTAAANEVVREINDASLGSRWLLVNDTQNPGGPGRMILVPVQKDASALLHAAVGRDTKPPLIVHAGDNIVVEEHFKFVDARLAARALSPATEGAAFNARLAIGGRIVHVTAIAPGRASLAAAGEADR